VNRLMLVAALACVACNAQEPAGDAPRPVQKTIAPAIAWPKENAVDARALDALGGIENVRALVARAPVPVLAPSDAKLEGAALVVEGEFYALNGRVDGATITIQGTRAAHRHEGVGHVPGTHDVRTARGFVTVNEGIRSASWIENGAAYSVDVECASAADARCTSDAFVTRFAEKLAYVGGAGR
jgi:hypothetical protein